MFNLPLHLVYDVLWQTFLNLVDSSPYFQDAGMTIDAKKGQILFPKNIGVSVASHARHTIGQAIFGGILDEANFGFSFARGNTKVYDTYTNILRRMESRFLLEMGRLPGTLFLVSSKRDESDFLEQHIENVQKNNIKSTLIIDACLLEVKKDVFPYSGKTFEVFVGNQMQSPFIIETDMDRRKADPG